MKTLIWRVVATIVGVLLIGGMFIYWPRQPATPVVVGDRRVILPITSMDFMLRLCSRNEPQQVSGFWAPSMSQVQQLEKDLLPYLQTEQKLHHTEVPLKNYYRQYAGFLRKSHTMIYINGFSEPMGDWTKQLVTVCDGGDQFFGVEYDIETHRFSELHFNGAI